MYLITKQLEHKLIFLFSDTLFSHKKLNNNLFITTYKKDIYKINVRSSKY